MVRLSKLQENPTNPRYIKDERFENLCKSIRESPWMLSIRPIVHKNWNITGGNMRFRALKKVIQGPIPEAWKKSPTLVQLYDKGMKEIPSDWVLDSDKVVKKLMGEGMTEAQAEEFIIKDNLGWGQWDMDMVASLYEPEDLLAWGWDGPNLDGFTAIEPEEEQEPKAKWVPDCIFPSNNMYDIPTLSADHQATDLDLPFLPWGSRSRTSTNNGTYHFYVDDYRFEGIWDNPNKVINSGIINACEPNLSLHELTPLSYGLFLIYKKRWIARYFQTHHINIFVDLNVHPKFADLNILGVPEGWNAFSTRGTASDLNLLRNDIKIAQAISGKKEPFMVVYGGGKKCKEIAVKHNLIFVDSKLELAEPLEA